jgi:hypothetical protein
MLIEPTKLLIHEAGRRCVKRNARGDDNALEMSQRRLHGVASSLHRPGASASHKMPVDEALDVLLGRGWLEPSTRPVPEVCKAVEIQPHRAWCVALPAQAVPVCLSKGTNSAGTQPPSRDWCQRIEDVHEDLLKWRCHIRRSDILCEVQVPVIRLKHRRLLGIGASWKPPFA